MNEAKELRRYEKTFPSNIDIAKEYELIQQKQSKLSRWAREKVIIVFEKTFKKIG